MKKCPYCTEEIQDNAVICKHCKRNLKEWSVYDPIRKVIRDTKAELNKIPPKTKKDIGKIIVYISVAIIASCLLSGILTGLYILLAPTKAEKKAYIKPPTKSIKQLRLKSKLNSSPIKRRKLEELK